MSHSLVGNAEQATKRHAGEQAAARTMLLLVVVFLLGLTVGAFWFYSSSKRGAPGASGGAGTAPALRLSESTRNVLARINSPLEIRSYAILDPATASDAETAFAARVDQLLSAYQQEAGDKIKVTRFTSLSDLKPNAAAADGIQVFNLDKSDACYLGLALVANGRKETLPRLSPEWEQALEPDLTRAIARLLDTPRSAGVGVPTVVSQVNTAALQEVKALIPNLATISLEGGKQVLQDAALKDFTAAAKEMEAQVKEAEQRLTQAQTGGTEADQQAAIKQLQQVQAEQTEKLRQIAARSKAQIDVFQQLKKTAQ
ncbi:MAG: Gldg family protein [Verrucomicrobia bacterium]|nr:Gldg family protein [Verrucomicrobiota bacterium]